MENTEMILPCPLCYGDSKLVIRETKYFCVECTNCHMRGPMFPAWIKEEWAPNFRGMAVANWNHLPRELQWSKEKPVKSGTYWIRDNNNVPNIAIIKEEDASKGVSVAVAPFMHFFPVSDFNDTTEWAGPIPMPREK